MAMAVAPGQARQARLAELSRQIRESKHQFCIDPAGRVSPLSWRVQWVGHVNLDGIRPSYRSEH
jgi:hypothetical protein